MKEKTGTERRVLTVWLSDNSITDVQCAGGTYSPYEYDGWMFNANERAHVHYTQRDTIDLQAFVQDSV